MARALEAVPGPPDADRLTELAHHYTVAAPLGCAEQAVRYLAQTATMRWALAFDTAVAHYEKALDLSPVSATPTASGQELELLSGSARTCRPPSAWATIGSRPCTAGPRARP